METERQTIELRFWRGALGGSFQLVGRHEGLVVGLCASPYCPRGCSSKIDQGFTRGIIEVELERRLPYGDRLTEFFLAHPIRVVQTTPSPTPSSALYPASGLLEADAISGLTAVCYTEGDDSLLVDCGAPPGQNGGHLEVLKRLLDAPGLQGCAITHAHLDHWGFYGLLGGKLPIFMEPLTSEFAARQEAMARRQAMRGSDAMAASVRSPNRAIAYIAGSEFEVGSFMVRSVRVAHSVPNASMFLIKTPGGKLLLHTGDFKFNGMDWRSRLRLEMQLKEIGQRGVEIMHCDNLNCHVDGFTQEEQRAVRGVAEVILRAPGSVFVALFASNLERIRALAQACIQDFSRPISFRGSGMFFASELLARERALPTGGQPQDQTVFFVTGCQAEEGSILYREVFDFQPELRLRENDTIVLSSRAIPGNEKSVKELIERLLERKCQVVLHQGETERLGIPANERLSEAFVHVSGHGQAGDVRLAMELVRPKKVIPAVRTSPQIEAFRKIAAGLGIEVLEPVDNHVVV